MYYVYRRRLALGMVARKLGEEGILFKMGESTSGAS